MQACERDQDQRARQPWLRWQARAGTRERQARRHAYTAGPSPPTPPPHPPSPLSGGGGPARAAAAWDGKVALGARGCAGTGQVVAGARVGGGPGARHLQGSRAPMSSRLGLAFDFSRWCRAGTVSVWSSGVWVLLARWPRSRGRRRVAACVPRVTRHGNPPATLLYTTVVGQTEGGRTRESRVFRWVAGKL